VGELLLFIVLDYWLEKNEVNAEIPIIGWRRHWEPPCLACADSGKCWRLRHGKKAGRLAKDEIALHPGEEMQSQEPDVMLLQYAAHGCMQSHHPGLKAASWSSVKNRWPQLSRLQKDDGHALIRPGNCSSSSKPA